MKLIDLLNDKSIKKIDVRNIIIDEIISENFSINDIIDTSKNLKENKISTILEAIEEISNKGFMNLSSEYLEFAKMYISSKDDSCKRESSRIIGNMASYYPLAVKTCIPELLDNTKDKGTIVRWASAYALSRIIQLKEYRNTELYERLIFIYDNEQDNGVRKQYLKAFKKITR